MLPFPESGDGSPSNGQVLFRDCNLKRERQLVNSTVKIHFRLKPSDDGYPSVAVESLWANSASDSYIVDSIPFFTSDATNGDRAIASPGEGGALWFDAVLQRSGNSLIRVGFFDATSQDDIVGYLTKLGCSTERMQQFKLLAIDVPPNVSLTVVQDYLQAQAAAGHIDYEEPILRQ